MGALVTIEKIVMRLEKEFQERRDVANRLDNTHKPIQSLFDFSNIVEDLENQNPDGRFNESLFDKLIHYTKYGYVFMLYAFYMACKDKLEMADKRTDGHLHFDYKEEQRMKTYIIKIKRMV